LEKDSKLADSNRPQPKYDALASKLQTLDYQDLMLNANTI